MFSFAYTPYIAIIGDLVGSKSLQERKKVQTELITILNDINSLYKLDISSKFMITLGDEFQGLMHHFSHVMDILDRIERELFPVRVRFGIGIGSVTTDINYDSPFGTDGPAYHSARKIIDKLKENEKKKMGAKSYIGIEVDGCDTISSLLNSIFSQDTIIKSKWTKRQWEIIRAFHEHGRTQRNAAAALGINQSSIQKALQSSGYYARQFAVQSVTDVMELLTEKKNA